MFCYFYVSTKCGNIRDPTAYYFLNGPKIPHLFYSHYANFL